MKILLSWSGNSSKTLAESLHEWLTLVFPDVTFWISSRDIQAGERWGNELDRELEATSFGILCLVPTNLLAPWLLFEAGALSKSVAASRVVPYCLGLQPEEVQGPLSRFQGVLADESGTRRLVESINSLLDSKRADSVLRQVFDKWWPDLKRDLEKIPAAIPQPELRSFCQRVAGHWWSLGADPDSVSFATIELDETTSTPMVNGRAYDLDGNTVAVWETTASCINLKRKKLYYYWEGWWPRRPGERYEGFGEISFYDAMDRFNTGIGVFFDTNLTDVGSTIKKSSDFLRCTEQEVHVMQGANKKGIGRLVQKKLNEFRKKDDVNFRRL
jgi:hypothetical protein